MNLDDELRSLKTPESVPDLSRAIMAQIERLDDNRHRVSVSDRSRAGNRHPVSVFALPAAIAALAVGSVLIVLSGVMATTIGPVGRSLAIAIPSVPSASLGPAALVAGILVYVVGLSLAGGRRAEARRLRAD